MSLFIVGMLVHDCSSVIKKGKMESHDIESLNGEFSSAESTRLIVREQKRTDWFSSEHVNKWDYVDCHGVPEMDTASLWYGIIFVCEPTALMYLEAKGVIDVPTECPKCAAKVARVRALATGVTGKVLDGGLPGGAIVETPWMNAWAMLHEPLHRDNIVVRCRGRERHKTSIFTGSFFQNCRIRKNKVLHIMYGFVSNMAISNITQMTGVDHEMVSQYLKYFHEMIVSAVLNDANESEIGGEGVIVEIDESKYRKHEYNRGHRVKGNWVFGGIE